MSIINAVVRKREEDKCFRCKESKEECVCYRYTSGLYKKNKLQRQNGW